MRRDEAAERKRIAASLASPRNGKRGRVGLRAARIGYIERLMSELHWREADAQALADQWGISLRTLRGMASEASKRVVARVTDPERVTANVCTALDRVIRESLECGDYRNTINAAATLAKILGVYKGLQDRQAIQVHAYAVQSIALPEVATPRPVRALEPAGQGVAQQSSAGELGAGESSAGESSGSPAGG